MSCESHDQMVTDIREIRKDVADVKGDVAYIRGKLDAQSSGPQPEIKVWFGPGLQRWGAIIATLLSLLGVGLGVSAHSTNHPVEIGSPGE